MKPTRGSDTMFYAKDENGTTIPIDTGNIFTVCPECRKEFSVTIYDFVWFIHVFDGSNMYCGECGAEEWDTTPTGKPVLRVIRGKGQ